jgi:hypothetical protein
MTPAELGRFLMEVALVRELADSLPDRTRAESLLNVAKNYRIDPEKLRAAARREDPKRKAPPPQRKKG